MTAALKVTIDKDKNIDWMKAHEAILDYLKDENYSQVPQLSGPESILKQTVFRGR
jgi:hypothetical protein